MQDMPSVRRSSAATRTPAKAAPVSTRNVTLARGKKTRPEAKEPLKKRRKKNKRALIITLGIVTLLFVAALFYAAWMPMLRVNSVSAEGPHGEEVKVLATHTLQGTHAFILPRNSLFFLPEEDIRAVILEGHPDIEAISIASDGLQGLRITTLPRAEAFSWCGVSIETPSELCYSVNAEGLIFAPSPVGVSSSTQKLKVYGSLEQEGDSPIRARMSHASGIPGVLRFVKAIQTLGADVVSVTLRGDEADLRTEAGTRITYVLGREQEAVGIAASVFPQLSLNDGSIQYVDLRFSGKAYFKRTEVPESVSE